MTKLCIDCKWSGGNHDDPFLPCHAPQNQESPPGVSPVTGKPRPAVWRYEFCSTHRAARGGFFNRVCGTQGRWWEPRISPRIAVHGDRLCFVFPVYTDRACTLTYPIEDGMYCVQRNADGTWPPVYLEQGKQLDLANAKPQA